MTRSHPPTLLTTVRRTLVEECSLSRGERLLVAVSGGGDSVALLHALSRLAPGLGISLVAHGVDHGLRAGSRAELDLAEGLSARCGVPFGRTALRVTPGGNLQARAREARRKALEVAAEECSATRIATAHHQDDRAETVLIRLLGGAAPHGLAVLPPMSGMWLRPLVRVKKSAIVAHLERHRLAFADDPSNRDPRFLRVRVRHELLPLLRELSPAIVDHLTRLADELGALGPDPVTRVLDDSGAPIPLRRAHAQALRRALRLGRPARIRLSEDREIHVDPGSGQICQVPVGEAKRRRRGPKPEAGGAGGRLPHKGGAKTGKSG